MRSGNHQHRLPYDHFLALPHPTNRRDHTKGKRSCHKHWGGHNLSFQGVQICFTLQRDYLRHLPDSLRMSCQ